jgi:hypothetical protein
MGSVKQPVLSTRETQGPAIVGLPSRPELVAEPTPSEKPSEFVRRSACEYRNSGHPPIVMSISGKANQRPSLQRDLYQSGPTCPQPCDRLHFGRWRVAEIS